MRIFADNTYSLSISFLALHCEEVKKREKLEVRIKKSRLKNENNHGLSKKKEIQNSWKTAS